MDVCFSTVGRTFCNLGRDSEDEPDIVKQVDQNQRIIELLDELKKKQGG
ncbi:hypothetical protein [Brevibacillus brevis]|nr:hypothetical protein [Brevibacillus brevis]